MSGYPLVVDKPKSGAIDWPNHDKVLSPDTGEEMTLASAIVDVTLMTIGINGNALFCLLCF
jgi:hypothetical protein